MRGETVRGLLILALLLAGILAQPLGVRSVIASTVLYIRADGAIEPSTTMIHRDGDVYTLTGNVNGSIVIERDNMVLDGAYWTVQGMQSQGGVVVNDRRNVTIMNLYIKGFQNGVIVQRSANVQITGNYISENNVSGILLNLTSFNSVIENQLASNGHHAICLFDSYNNTIFHNNIMFSPKLAFANNSRFNVWDNGYPSGGNYWTDYTGVDWYHGSYQNLTGSDGLGDSPYGVDLENEDRHPLSMPYMMRQMLFISSTTNPVSIGPGDNVEVQLFVTCGNSSISNATVQATLSNSQIGIEYHFSGDTNSDGYFTINFTAPTLETPTTFTFSINASKRGYLSGLSQSQVTVQSAYVEPQTPPQPPPLYPPTQPRTYPYAEPQGQMVTVVGTNSQTGFISVLLSSLFIMGLLIAVVLIVIIAATKASGGKSARPKRPRKIIIP